MIPFGLDQDQFSQRLIRSLEDLSDHSIQCIRGFLLQPIPAAVQSVEFQLFVDAENYGAPSIWAYFVGDNLKSSELSREVALNLDELEEMDDRYFTDFKFSGVNLMADVLKSWFADCWWKAGGGDFGVPAVLDVHDGCGDRRSTQLTN